MVRKFFVVFVCIMLLTGLITPSCLAGEPVSPELELNEAITMALKNSKNVQKAALGIDKAKEQRDHAADQIDFTPTPGESSYSPQVEAAFYNMLTSDLSWRISKRSASMEEDRLVLDTCRKYWEVQKAIENVKSKQAAVDATELTLRRTQAMVRLGMVPQEFSGASPQMALKAAEGALAGAKTALTTAQNDLSSAYESLNQLIGLWPQDRPELVEQIDFEPIKVDDLETAVKRTVEVSPNLWIAQESANLSKYASEMLWASGQYTPYKVKQIEKQQAELDAVSAKDAVKLATRDLYYTAVNLEAAREAAEKELARAEEALRVAGLQYNLGLITKENLNKAKSTLADARKTMVDLTTQHAYIKMAFQKPWAVSM